MSPHGQNQDEKVQKFKSEDIDHLRLTVKYTNDEDKSPLDQPFFELTEDQQK